MEPGNTRWIEWELGMIRELGLQPRFFVVTPPGGDLRWSRRYRRVGHAVLSIVARLSRSTPPTWQEFSARRAPRRREPAHRVLDEERDRVRPSSCRLPALIKAKARRGRRRYAPPPHTSLSSPRR